MIITNTYETTLDALTLTNTRMAQLEQQLLQTNDARLEVLMKINTRMTGLEKQLIHANKRIALLQGASAPIAPIVRFTTLLRVNRFANTHLESLALTDSAAAERIDQLSKLMKIRIDLIEDLTQQMDQLVERLYRFLQN